MTYQTITVHTQAELDAALAAHSDDWRTTILIDSPAEVWLKIRSSGSAVVQAYGSSNVRASESASVRASGSASVRAHESATVWAYGSANIEACDSATVWAYGSASVEASGSAIVHAHDSATVQASKCVAVHLHSARVTLSGGIAKAKARTVHVLDEVTLDGDVPDSLQF